MSTRKVTIWSTKGKKKTVLESSASTWGTLKNEVSDAGYDISELRATENINKTTLEHNDAVVPEGDFILFLRPVQTKSGAKAYNDMSFRELRAQLTDGDKEILKEGLGDRNWTQASTQELKDFLNSRGAESAPVESNSSAIEDASSDLAKLKQAQALVQSVYDEGNFDDDEEEEERLETLLDEFTGVISAFEVDDETEELEIEAEDFLDGFDED